MNKYIIVSFVSLVLCQILKFVIESIKTKKLAWVRIINGCGGMPSSHTAFTVSLTTMIGLCEGINSSIFAVAVVFTFVVIFDAMGVRLQSEKQAEAINEMADSLIKMPWKKRMPKLKEELGHEPLEVFMGALFGILFALLFNTFVF